MLQTFALGPGNQGNCQLVSFDAFGGFPCVDFQDFRSGGWNPWGPLPGPAKKSYATLAVGVGNEKNLNVILLGEDDHQPYLCSQAAGNGVWSFIAPLPGVAHPAGYSAVAMAQGNEGNLQAVLLGCDDGQPYLYWQAAGNGIWTGPTPLTAARHAAGFSAVALGAGNDGNLQLVVLGRDDHQPYLYWQAAGNGIWSGPTPLTASTHPAGFSALAVGPGDESNLQVILLGRDDGQPYLYWQAAGNGIWSGPTPLTSARHAAGFSAITAGTGNDGNLQVVLLAADTNQPFFYWQAVGNGIWTGPVPLLPGVTLPATVELHACPAFSQGANQLQVVFRPKVGNTLLLAWQNAQGNWTYYGELFHPTWMQEIAPSIANRKLTHLFIPGTHDSGTFGITANSSFSPDSPIPSGAIDGGIEAGTVLLSVIPVIGPLLSTVLGTLAQPAQLKQLFAGWAVAQVWDFRQQLRAGIRHFDIRVCKNPQGEFWIVHSMYSVPVLTLLKQVAEFLTLNRQELVTLDFNHTINMTSADDPVLIEQIFTVLGPWLAPSTQFQPDSTVADFWATPSRVIVTYYFDGRRPFYGEPHIWPSSNMRGKGPIDSQEWPATTVIGDLNTSLAGYLLKRAPNQLFVLQGILTPDNSSIVGHYTGGAPDLEAMSGPATQAVISWLPGWTENLNIVIVDHVENAPTYVRTMIRLNVEQGTASGQPAPAAASASAG